MFTVTDKAGRALVTWTDGQISGDTDALAAVFAAVATRESVAVTPTGPTYQAALTPGYVALATILDLLPGGLATGDVPEYPAADIDVPPGATP